MADLETCYFCGEGPSEAVQEYGVVPAVFEPTEEQQRSVVLCPSCNDKLTAVMRATVEASGAAGGTSRDEHATDTQRDSAGAERSGGESTERDRRGSTEREESVTDSLADAGTTDRAVTDGRQSSPGTAASEGSTDADTDDNDTDASNEADEDDGIRRTEGEGVSFGTATAGDEGAEGGDAGEETPPQRETGAASVGNDGEDVMGRDSETYRQVIRLLQNREFPVQRDEIAEVAASAYELSPTETQDAIDAIVQKGMLVEEDGVLRRP